MRLSYLNVKNFRALENVEIEFEKKVNVIVGPNAIGKTTVLEAIRLVKSVLAPRTQNETTQVLFALGASVPYNPMLFIPEAIARDRTRPVEIRCRYVLTPDEVAILDRAVPQIATEAVLRSAGQGFQNPSLGISLLSSPQGQSALKAAEVEVRGALDTLRANNYVCRLELVVDSSSGRFQGAGDQIGAALIAHLDRRLPPALTAMSYFPADRALPAGEQPIQIGMADANLQLESHFSQPQLKYARLKNTIFNAVVASPAEREDLDREFRRIFAGILKGRELVSVGVNAYGLLSIEVKDVETGRTFSLDGMSSGEKGLILTFLIIGRSLMDGGIVLLDEPELHLNPAVCKNLVSFLVEEYAIRKKLQIIICSHSPEILAGTFDQEECGLYHLVSEKLMEPLRRVDRDEVSEALNKLGTSEGEGLLYKSTLFVEGEEDVELLEVGFGDLLRKHKIKDLGGRNEVEKQITFLQEVERRGDKLAPKYFIFDRDERPTGLTSSGAVKVLQWGRRCLENYLIDLDVLTELLRNPEIAQAPLSNSGEVSRLLKEIAKSQLNDFVARKVYARSPFESLGVRSTEIQGKQIPEIAEVLFARLNSLRAQLNPVTDDWKQNFISACNKDLSELELVWDEKWREDCDGKRLFASLQTRIPLRMSIRRFKKRVMGEMRAARTENWRAIESLLSSLVGA